MKENEASRVVVNTACELHQNLGPGLLETVNKIILAYELNKAGLRLERQVPVKIHWDRITFDEGFRADLIVESKVTIELKSEEQLHPVAAKQ